MLSLIVDSALIVIIWSVSVVTEKILYLTSVITPKVLGWLQYASVIAFWALAYGSLSGQNFLHMSY